MSLDTITHLVLQYRYWILIPLTIIEGPIVAFVAGTLAAVGYFNLYLLGVIFFVRDVGLDIMYYAIGHYSGRTGFGGRMLAKVGITTTHLDHVRDLWARRPGWTMLVGKLSYGIATAFIIAAGIVKMPFRIFIKYGVAVAVLEYGTILLAGYFLGNSLGGSADHVLTSIQYTIAIGAVLITIYYALSWRARMRFLEEEKKDEEILDKKGD